MFLHGFVESANNTIVPGGWSIATEMTFYLIFPLLFVKAKNFITSSSRLLTFVFFGIIISQVLNLILIKSGFYLANNTFLYYNISNQLPCFFIGIGYFFYLKLFEKTYNKAFDYILFIAFTLASLVAWSLKIGYLFSWTPFLSSLSFVFLIEIFRKNERINIKILSEIGKVSYSMYLFHFLIVYCIPIFFDNWVQYGIISLISIYPIIVLITYILARLSFSFIELPCISLGRKLICLVGERLKKPFFRF